MVGAGVKNIGSRFLRISLTPFNDTVKNKKTALKTVTLPNSLITIGQEAFFNHDYLKKITIPKNVTTIGVRAFAYNGNAVYTFKRKTPPTFKSGAFKIAKNEKKPTWKVPKTKKWKSLSAKIKKYAGFTGKIKYY